jgi:hypothetical protein
MFSNVIFGFFHPSTLTMAFKEEGRTRAVFAPFCHQVDFEAENLFAPLHHNDVWRPRMERG